MHHSKDRTSAPGAWVEYLDGERRRGDSALLRVWNVYFRLVCRPEPAGTNHRIFQLKDLKPRESHATCFLHRELCSRMVCETSKGAQSSLQHPSGSLETLRKNLTFSAYVCALGVTA